MRHIILFAIMVLVVAGIVPRVMDRVGGAPAASSAVATAPPADAAPVRRGRTGTTAYVHSDRNGHFVSDIEIGGRSVKAMIDTGATNIALRYEDARDLGLLRVERFDRKVSTANGVGEAMMVRLNDVRIGDVVIYDVEAMVLKPGVLSTNLLGMSFLRRLSRFEVRSDEVVLEQ
jgi:aspartyl protease family protein